MLLLYFVSYFFFWFSSVYLDVYFFVVVDLFLVMHCQGLKRFDLFWNLIMYLVWL